MESDSLIVVKIINGVRKVPWEVAKDMEEIKVEIAIMDLKTQHIFREGNKLVDNIANLATTSTEKQTFHSFHQL